ncbi:hypothetical protein COLO4_01995 [Corchorus olitorius]|uniref:Uncharacterized protein n=1 Tax=Corchorus olitorius TaxID=93759 RepID=A0A1R3L1T9_9ROSI|nr:hypothetical protein COLO4_01995 [Corchorus olitorius]
MASRNFSPPRLWSSSKPSRVTTLLCRSTKFRRVGSTSGYLSYSASAICWISFHFMMGSLLRWPVGSVVFLGVVDRVLRNLDGQVRLRHLGLTGQARVRLQAPGLVEQILFLLGRLIQRIEALAHDHVAGRAGARLLACMLDLDVSAQQRIADGRAGLGFDHGPFRAVFDVRKDDDVWHEETRSISVFGEMRSAISRAPRYVCRRAPCECRGPCGVRRIRRCHARGHPRRP